MLSYATVEEYRADTGDSSSEEERVKSLLAQQSAKLRAKAHITEALELTEDQLMLARLLVVDAVRKCLVTPSVGLEGIDLTGTTQGSFSANGFQQSWEVQNPSGVAYFDNDTFKAFMRSLRKSQQIGMICPSYGGRND